MPPNGNVQATIDGDIKGQVAVGNYILQIGNVNGGVVNVAPQSQGPNYTRRKAPINLRPRPFPALLDRDDETATLISAFQASTSVSLFGPAGIGKTSLLRNVAHLPEISSFPDGIVYLSVSGLGLDDVLQAVFDAFHESQTNFKPKDTETRVAMQGVKALILLDDLSLTRDETTSLLDAIPGCTLVLASLERSIWGEGQIISLHGLPTEEALDLFVLELNRSLDEREQAEAREICELLDGHPLKVLQSASLVREKTRTIASLKAEVQRDASESTIVNASLNMLTESQQRLLAIMAAGGGAVVPESHLEALSNSQSPKTELQGLVSLGLVQAHSPRYSLTGSLTASIAALWDLSSWEDALINYFVDWLSQQPAQTLVEESADVLVSSIKKAGEKKRWPEVIRLGRTLERILILWKRWQTWLDILNLILKAARALGDRKVEAWALHQLGTRAACLGLNESARGFLTQALQIRQAIGDRAGLALTQNNLHVFFKVPLPPEAGQSGCRRCLTCGAIGAGVAAVAAVVIAGAFLFLSQPSTPPPTLPTETPTPTQTPLSTPEATMSPTNTATSFVEDTHTPSPTPTVPTDTPTPVILVDLVETAPKARWYGNNNQNETSEFYVQVPLEFGIKYPDPIGFAVWDDPVLENEQAVERVLFTRPYYQFEASGLVTGFYDLRGLPLEKDFRFVASVGFVQEAKGTEGAYFNVFFNEDDSTFCSATYTSPCVLLGQTYVLYDGRLQDFVFTIPPEVVGRRGWLALQVDSGEQSPLDLAVWVTARLERP